MVRTTPQWPCQPSGSWRRSAGAWGRRACCGTSGPVRVSGTQRAEGIASLRVQAFGREYVLPANLVAELQGFNANGLFVSYESGYKELGGRTVYLGFVRGFTSGIQAAKHVAVSENGEFKLLKGLGQ